MGRSGAEALANAVFAPMSPKARSASRSGKATVRQNQAPSKAGPFLSVMVLNIANLLFQLGATLPFPLIRKRVRVDPIDQGGPAVLGAKHDVGMAMGNTILVALTC